MTSATNAHSSDPTPVAVAGGDDRRRILIVRLSSVGDVAFALPALENLRAHRPNAHIAWVVEDRSSSLIEGHPLLDETIVMPRKEWIRRRKEGAGRLEILREMRRFGKSLARREFDVAVDFQGNIKSGLVTWASRAPIRIGLPRSETKEPNWLFTTDRPEMPAKIMHRAERDLFLVSQIGIPFEFRWPRLHCPLPERAVVDEFLAAHSHDKRPIALLHPGTSAWGPHKRWPTAYYAQLAKDLVEKAGARVVLNWGPGEEELLEEIEAACEVPLQRAPRLANMRQVAYFVQKMDVVVGSDTGPTHLAALLNRPTIILFGPYDPRLYYPYQHPERARFAGIGCSPCRYRGCPARDCMRLISPESVFENCFRALRGLHEIERDITPRKTVRV